MKLERATGSFQDHERASNGELGTEEAFVERSAEKRSLPGAVRGEPEKGHEFTKANAMQEEVLLMQETSFHSLLVCAEEVVGDGFCRRGVVGRCIWVELKSACAIQNEFKRGPYRGSGRE